VFRVSVLDLGGVQLLVEVLGVEVRIREGRGQRQPQVKIRAGAQFDLALGEGEVEDVAALCPGIVDEVDVAARDRDVLLVDRGAETGDDTGDVGEVLLGTGSPTSWAPIRSQTCTARIYLC
jgi:hypothetical protein